MVMRDSSPLLLVVPISVLSATYISVIKWTLLKVTLRWINFCHISFKRNVLSFFFLHGRKANIVNLDKVSVDYKTSFP